VVLIEHADLNTEQPDYNLGIRFSEMSDAQQQMLGEFIVNLQKKSIDFQKKLQSYWTFS
jgi:c-di-GMP-binding flagellar brake protein YcgR